MRSLSSSTGCGPLMLICLRMKIELAGLHMITSDIVSQTFQRGNKNKKTECGIEVARM